MANSWIGQTLVSRDLRNPPHTMKTLDPRALLRAMFDAAIARAQPALCIPPHLPAPGSLKGRLVVIEIGRAHV